MKRGLDIPTEVGNLLSAAERHDAAAIVYDHEDRVVVCNDRFRHLYKHFEYYAKHTYRTLALHTISRGLNDDPEMKSDPEAWIKGAVDFRRSHKLAQYLIHYKSGKTALAHHQVFDGFGSIAIRFDITNHLKIRKGENDFGIPGFNIFLDNWVSSNIGRRFEAPTAILSRGCNLIDANELFMRLLGRKDGLNIQGSRVFLESRREDKMFQEAVMEKSFQGATGNKLIRVSRMSEKSYFIVSVFPMSPEASVYNPSMHGVSLVSVLVPEQRLPVNVKPLIDLFGLTSVEARVAALIGEGKDLYEISSENGTSIGTVRNQLKSVFSKMGVNRQSELVRIIHRIHQINSASLVGN